jgi:hypothetical protein
MIELKMKIKRLFIWFADIFISKDDKQMLVISIYTILISVISLVWSAIDHESHWGLPAGVGVCYIPNVITWLIYRRRQVITQTIERLSGDRNLPVCPKCDNFLVKMTSHNPDKTRFYCLFCKVWIKFEND